MTLEQFYDTTGGSYQKTLSRLPGEALIRKFVLKYQNDGTCQMLADAIEGQDWEAAFRAAHTLKGIALNLGFDALYRVSRELTEALRGDRPLTDPDLWTAVRDQDQAIRRAIAELDR